MKRWLVGLALLGLVACAGVTIQQVVGQIVDYVKQNCDGLVANAGDLVSALTGVPVSKIIVSEVGASICNQWRVSVSQDPPKADAGPACVVTTVNGKPVKACK